MHDTYVCSSMYILNCTVCTLRPHHNNTQSSNQSSLLHTHNREGKRTRYFLNERRHHRATEIKISRPKQPKPQKQPNPLRFHQQQKRENSTCEAKKENIQRKLTHSLTVRRTMGNINRPRPPEDEHHSIFGDYF